MNHWHCRRSARGNGAVALGLTRRAYPSVRDAASDAESFEAIRTFGVEPAARYEPGREVAHASDYRLCRLLCW